MDSKLRKGLPIIAVIGAVIALVCLSVLSVQRRTPVAETGETRRSVEGILSQIESTRPASLDDGPFREAIARVKDAPYIAVVWLFTPEGQIVEGSRAFSHGTVEASAPGEIHRLLAALPKGTLNGEQRTALLAASVMQAERERTEAYRHLLREVRGPQGEVVALVGVTYDASPAVDTHSALWILSLLGGFLGLVAYWLALPAWVWLDARDRGERAWVWAIFVLLGNLVGLITYILVHRPSPHPPQIQ